MPQRSNEEARKVLQAELDAANRRVRSLAREAAQMVLDGKDIARDCSMLIENNLRPALMRRDAFRELLSALVEAES